MEGDRHRRDVPPRLIDSRRVHLVGSYGPCQSARDLVAEERRRVQILALVAPLGQPGLDRRSAPTVQRKHDERIRVENDAHSGVALFEFSPRLACEGHAVDIRQLRAKLGEAGQGHVEVAVRSPG